MKYLLIAFAISTHLLLGSQIALAQTATASVAAATTATTDMADGEVRKIDKENKKITLKHGVIKSMDMPAMTMVFGVKDAAMLDSVKVGDKIKFTAATAGSALVIQSIQPKP
jgi:Cu(I)/Ag(I) efflux system periplasmic protein CusF